MRSGGSVGHGVTKLIARRHRHAAVVGGLDDDPVRPRHRDEHRRVMRHVGVGEERDRGVDEVELERAPRAQPVARAERVDRLAVEAQEVDRRARAHEPRALMPVEVAVHVDHELVDERAREGRALDHVVLAVGALEGGRLVEALLHAAQQLAHALQLRLRDARGERLEQRRLDDEAQRVDLLGGRDRHGRDGVAVIRRRDHEAVVLQPAERVAQRRAPEAQHLHQLRLRQALPGIVDALDDEVAQPGVRLLDGVARARDGAGAVGASAIVAVRSPSTQSYRAGGWRGQRLGARVDPLH